MSSSDNIFDEGEAPPWFRDLSPMVKRMLVDIAGLPEAWLDEYINPYTPEAAQRISGTSELGFAAPAGLAPTYAVGIIQRGQRAGYWEVINDPSGRYSYSGRIDMYEQRYENWLLSNSHLYSLSNFEAGKPLTPYAQYGGQQNLVNLAYWNFQQEYTPLSIGWSAARIGLYTAPEFGAPKLGLIRAFGFPFIDSLQRTLATSAVAPYAEGLPIEQFRRTSAGWLAKEPTLGEQFYQGILQWTIAQNVVWGLRAGIGNLGLSGGFTGGFMSSLRQTGGINLMQPGLEMMISPITHFANLRQLGYEEEAEEYWSSGRMTTQMGIGAGLFATGAYLASKTFRPTVDAGPQARYEHRWRNVTPQPTHMYPSGVMYPNEYPALPPSSFEAPYTQLPHYALRISDPSNPLMLPPGRIIPAAHLMLPPPFLSTYFPDQPPIKTTTQFFRLQAYVGSPQYALDVTRQDLLFPYTPFEPQKYPPQMRAPLRTPPMIRLPDLSTPATYALPPADTWETAKFRDWTTIFPSMGPAIPMGGRIQLSLPSSTVPLGGMVDQLRLPDLSVVPPVETWATSIFNAPSTRSPIPLEGRVGPQLLLPDLSAPATYALPSADTWETAKFRDWTTKYPAIGPAIPMGGPSLPGAATWDTAHLIGLSRAMLNPPRITLRFPPTALVSPMYPQLPGFDSTRALVGPISFPDAEYMPGPVSSSWMPSREIAVIPPPIPKDPLRVFNALSTAAAITSLAGRIAGGIGGLALSEYIGSEHEYLKQQWQPINEKLAQMFPLVARSPTMKMLGEIEYTPEMQQYMDIAGFYGGAVAGGAAAQKAFMTYAPKLLGYFARHPEAIVTKGFAFTGSVLSRLIPPIMAAESASLIAGFGEFAYAINNKEPTETFRATAAPVSAYNYLRDYALGSLRGLLPEGSVVAGMLPKRPEMGIMDFFTDVQRQINTRSQAANIVYQFNPWAAPVIAATIELLSGIDLATGQSLKKTEKVVTPEMQVRAKQADVFMAQYAIIDKMYSEAQGFVNAMFEGPGIYGQNRGAIARTYYDTLSSIDREVDKRVFIARNKERTDLVDEAGNLTPLGEVAITGGTRMLGPLAEPNYVTIDGHKYPWRGITVEELSFQTPKEMQIEYNRQQLGRQNYDEARREGIYQGLLFVSQNNGITASGAAWLIGGFQAANILQSFGRTYQDAYKQAYALEGPRSNIRGYSYPYYYMVNTGGGPEMMTGRTYMPYGVNVPGQMPWEDSIWNKGVTPIHYNASGQPYPVSAGEMWLKANFPEDAKFVAGGWAVQYTGMSPGFPRLMQQDILVDNYGRVNIGVRTDVELAAQSAYSTAFNTTLQGYGVTISTATPAMISVADNAGKNASVRRQFGFDSVDDYTDPFPYDVPGRFTASGKQIDPQSGVTWDVETSHVPAPNNTVATFVPSESGWDTTPTWITAQHGIDMIVNKPTKILAGEGGAPEHVMITPLSGGGGNSINRIIQAAVANEMKRTLRMMELANKKHTDDVSRQLAKNIHLGSIAR